MADLSHWINVAETDTNDPDLTQVIEDFAHQTFHVHCRVGYDHGPQVLELAQTQHAKMDLYTKLIPLPMLYH